MATAATVFAHLPPFLLTQLRSSEDALALLATRIEASYALLESHGADLPPGDADAAANAVAALKRVSRAGADAATRLEAAAPALARDLARDATALCAEADTLCSEWDGGAALADAGAADGRATLAGLPTRWPRVRRAGPTWPRGRRCTGFP